MYVFPVMTNVSLWPKVATGKEFGSVCFGENRHSNTICQGLGSTQFRRPTDCDFPLDAGFKTPGIKLVSVNRYTVPRFVVFNPGHYGKFSGLIVNIELETKRIQDFVDKGNYHAAYNIALSGLNACRRANDQPGTDLFIEIIRGVVDSLAREFGSQPPSR